MFASHEENVGNAMKDLFSFVCNSAAAAAVDKANFNRSTLENTPPSAASTSTEPSTWQRRNVLLDHQSFQATDDSSDPGNSYNSDSISGVIKAELVPVVCAFGLIGNVLTLLVLSCEPVRRVAAALGIGGGSQPSCSSGRTRRTYGGRMTQQSASGSAERTVNVWLKALAVSDFLLCASLLPHSVVASEGFIYDHVTFELAFKTYGGAIINNFMLTSTWLTVAMSVGRYLAICHPLGIGRIRRVGGPAAAQTAARRTAAGVFMACSMLNIPRFFEHRIDVIPCPDVVITGSTNATEAEFSNLPDVVGQNRVVYTRSWGVLLGTTGRTIYAWIHFLVGVVVPLMTVAFCNVRLVNALRQTGRDLRRDIVYGMSSGRQRQQQQQQQQDEDLSVCKRHPQRPVRARSTAVSAASGRRTTSILIAVVLVYLASVTPGEILSFIDEYHQLASTISHVWLLPAIEATNILQAFNYSFNWVLYALLNVHFRRAIEYTICCRITACRHRHHTGIPLNSSSPTSSSCRSSRTITSTSGVVCDLGCCRHQRSGSSSAENTDRLGLLHISGSDRCRYRRPSGEPTTVATRTNSSSNIQMTSVDSRRPSQAEVGFVQLRQWWSSESASARPDSDHLGRSPTFQGPPRNSTSATSARASSGTVKANAAIGCIFADKITQL